MSCLFAFRKLLSGLLSFFALAFVGSLNACQTATELPDSGYGYQPLEKANFWIYEVTEQRFALNGTSTTQTYQWRETIVQVYTDSTVRSLPEGRVYRLERYRRASDSQPWQPDSVSSLRITDNQLIKNENNISYAKLVFPVVDQFQWNGNAYNAIGEDLYQFRNPGKPFTVLNQPFAETVTVVQQNDSTLVSQDKRLEIYARQVGLIYKEKVQLQFCSSTPSCVGKAQIDFGIRQSIRLRSYGRE
ncbi:hypothetical protein ACO2Q8_26605 [Larkinella sp. VNQ87]|uniref:hypothetical protein n=1 Tax=Larkinella sp. VNQ87 TaxID=3400921 RepID=UPI003C00D97A